MCLAVGAKMTAMADESVRRGYIPDSPQVFPILSLAASMLVEYVSILKVVCVAINSNSGGQSPLAA